MSKTKNFIGDNLITVASLQEAIAISEGSEVYIAGGYGLFKEALPLVNKMYITEIDTIVDDGDVFFPDFDAEEFDITIGEVGGEDIRYTRTIYTRKNNN